MIPYEDTSKLHPHLSDADLLQCICDDLRTLYATILKQPLPHLIAATLERLDEERCRPQFSDEMMPRSATERIATTPL